MPTVTSELDFQADVDRGGAAPLTSPADLAIPICVKTADEAIEHLRQDHHRWQHETRV